MKIAAINNSTVFTASEATNKQTQKEAKMTREKKAAFIMFATIAAATAVAILSLQKKNQIKITHTVPPMDINSYTLVPNSAIETEFSKINPDVVNIQKDENAGHFSKLLKKIFFCQKENSVFEEIKEPKIINNGYKRYVFEYDDGKVNNTLKYVIDEEGNFVHLYNKTKEGIYKYNYSGDCIKYFEHPNQNTLIYGDSNLTLKSTRKKDIYGKRFRHIRKNFKDGNFDEFIKYKQGETPETTCIDNYFYVLNTKTGKVKFKHKLAKQTHQKIQNPKEFLKKILIADFPSQEGNKTFGIVKNPITLKNGTKIYKHQVIVGDVKHTYTLKLDKQNKFRDLFVNRIKTSEDGSIEKKLIRYNQNHEVLEKLHKCDTHKSYFNFTVGSASVKHKKIA